MAKFKHQIEPTIRITNVFEYFIKFKCENIMNKKKLFFFFSTACHLGDYSIEHGNDKVVNKKSPQKPSRLIRKKEANKQKQLRHNVRHLIYILFISSDQTTRLID